MVAEQLSGAKASMATIIASASSSVRDIEKALGLTRNTCCSIACGILPAPSLFDMVSSFNLSLLERFQLPVFLMTAQIKVAASYLRLGTDDFVWPVDIHQCTIVDARPIRHAMKRNQP